VRFNCGPSLVQRLDDWSRRRRNWHRWFAWRPVRLPDNTCVWWEWVERMNTGPACEGGWDEWETRELPPEAK
jgi:hypothetical protein